MINTIESAMVFVGCLLIKNAKWNRKRLSFDFANRISSLATLCGIQFHNAQTHREIKDGRPSMVKWRSLELYRAVSIWPTRSLVMRMQMTESALHSIANMPISRWFKPFKSILYSRYISLLSIKQIEPLCRCLSATKIWTLTVCIVWLTIY